MRWFRARLEGSYFGVSPAIQGRRHQLQVYRAALRDLAWIDAPELAPDGELLRLLQIEHAHVAGVRGPGTWYEGPIFDVSIIAPQLSCPVERAGRSYGRVTGTAVGWLELPELPPQPTVSVTEREAPKLLAATVYTETAVAAEPSIEAAPKPRLPVQLPLVALVLLLGIALGVAYGAFAVGMWSLFMVPTLIARQFFRDVLRDSGFIRGFGYALLMVLVLCASALLTRSWSDGCATPPLWAAITIGIVLFPAGLLPSRLPIGACALALALVLSTFLRASDEHCGTATLLNVSPPKLRAE